MSFRRSIRRVPGRMVQLRLHLSDLVDESAKAFASRLSENIARGPRSGPVYGQFGKLWPASVPGEYPQEQSSNLRSSVGVMTGSGEDLTRARAGFFADLADNPRDLRTYLAEVEGFPIGAEGDATRYPLRMTAEDQGTIEAIRAVVLEFSRRRK